MRFPGVANRSARVQNRPPLDRRKNLATYHGEVPGTCADRTHTSCWVLGGLRARARPFRAVSRRFGAASVRSAQSNIYRGRGHVRYIEGPGADIVRRPRYPQTVTRFPAPTSAPGALWTTKPPPEVPNRVSSRHTYPLDALVMERRRLGGPGPRQGLLETSPARLQIDGARSAGTSQKLVLAAIPVGRGPRDA